MRHSRRSLFPRLELFWDNDKLLHCPLIDRGGVPHHLKGNDEGDNVLG